MPATLTRRASQKKGGNNPHPWLQNNGGLTAEGQNAVESILPLAKHFIKRFSRIKERWDGAEDALQGAVVAAHKAILRFARSGSTDLDRWGSYCGTVLRRALLYEYPRWVAGEVHKWKHRRRSPFRPLVIDPTRLLVPDRRPQGVPGDWGPDELQAELKEGLTLLTLRQRRAVRGYLSGKTLTEIGGGSKTVGKNLIANAKKRLRRLRAKGLPTTGRPRLVG